MTETANWSVRPTADNDRRTHFMGLEKDARRYVEDNFPRPHIADANQDIVPDVALHGPEGVVYHFMNGEWVDANAVNDVPDDDVNEMPSVGDNKAAWVAYAESQGDEYASSKTKNELIAEYTTEE